MTYPNDPAFASEGVVLAVKDAISKDPALLENVIAIAQRFNGLTKREYFATIIMGHLAELSIAEPNIRARYAVEWADALITELNNHA